MKWKGRQPFGFCNTHHWHTSFIVFRISLLSSFAFGSSLYRQRRIPMRSRVNKNEKRNTEKKTSCFLDDTIAILLCTLCIQLRLPSEWVSACISLKQFKNGRVSLVLLFSVHLSSTTTTTTNQAKRLLSNTCTPIHRCTTIFKYVHNNKRIVLLFVCTAESEYSTIEFRN